MIVTRLLRSVQGVEIGSGFSGSEMLGSEHNDEFFMDDGVIRTRTNRCEKTLKTPGHPWARAL